ncbi:SPW repeat domain-containing protein [Mesoaciditoga sp.]
MSWKGWVALILGIWFVVAAFIPGMLGIGNLVNDLIVGIVLAIVGFMMIPSGSAWQGWIIGLIGGVWMIIAAFIPQITHSYTINMTNDLVVGILVLIIALFERSKKKA